MTIKGGTTPACAACKYQRRKCSSKCALAPYFPASEPSIFQNAHKLFGVSNIMKILNKMDTQELRDEAMKSIKFESYLRERFPVDGCVGYIEYLQQQLVQYSQEYFYVCSRLAMCREEFHEQLINQKYPPPSELQLGMTLGNNPTPLAVVPYHQDDGMLLPYEVNPHEPIGANDKGVYFGQSDEIKKQLWGQDLNYTNSASHNDQIRTEMQMDPFPPFQTQEETEVDYDEMPFYTTADDRKSCIESREACDSSCESWKDTAANLAANNLRRLPNVLNLQV